MPTPVGPRPRPDVVLPPGTHLLFAQSGRIEHVPLEGYDMKKEDAKVVLHLPVSFSHPDVFKGISQIIQTKTTAARKLFLPTSAQALTSVCPLPGRNTSSCSVNFPSA